MIPLIFLIAIVLILRYMYKERKSETIITVDDIVLTDEQAFLIEQTMQRDLMFCREYWRGRFNTSHYVKVLEYKHSKGLM